MDDCRTCRINRGEDPAPGGVIYRDALWQLEHTIEPIPMVSWLVLKPLRHVEAFADLAPDEAAAFGPLVLRITQAMTAVLKPEKIYLSMYMEARGFAHLHVHLIPRFADTPVERRGPRVFEYLRESVTSGQNLAPVEDAAATAGALRRLLAHTADA